MGNIASDGLARVKYSEYWIITQGQMDSGIEL